MIEPAVKKTTAVRIIALRPKISEKTVKRGTNAVAATRNAIPSQKVSNAEPFNSVAMVYNPSVLTTSRSKVEHTGRAMERAVASQAVTRFNRQMQLAVI